MYMFAWKRGFKSGKGGGWAGVEIHNREIEPDKAVWSWAGMCSTLVIL